MNAHVRMLLLGCLMLLSLSGSSSLVAMEFAGGGDGAGVVLVSDYPAANQAMLNRLDTTPEGKAVKTALAVNLYYNVLANVLFKKIGTENFSLRQVAEGGAAPMIRSVIGIVAALFFPETCPFHDEHVVQLARATVELPGAITQEILQQFSEKADHFLTCAQQAQMTPETMAQLAELANCDDRALFIQKLRTLPLGQLFSVAEQETLFRSLDTFIGFFSAQVMVGVLFDELGQPKARIPSNVAVIDILAQFKPDNFSAASLHAQMHHVFFHLVSMLLNITYDVLDSHYHIGAHRCEYLALIAQLHQYIPAQRMDAVLEEEVTSILAGLGLNK